jgi:hypothetical protein
MDKSKLLQRREALARRRKTAITVVIGVFLISAVAVFASYEPYVPEITGRPNLSLDRSSINFGTLPLNQAVSAEFRVRNTGDQPLTITNEPFVRVAEGCCPPDLQITAFTIKPGRESVISMTFMMHEGMDGAHDFRILLQINDPTQPETELTVLSNWE